MSQDETCLGIPEDSQRPIFILGSHKSGSSLLRSLLDGHPQLFAIPTEVHFFQFTGHWVNYHLRYSWPRQMSRQEMIDSLVDLVQRKDSHDDPFADSTIAGKIDLEKFENHLRSNYSEASYSELFQGYIEAFYLALCGYEIPKEIRIIEKSVENAEFAGFLRKIFPRCQFIHIVRNPYASLVAIRKSKSKKQYPFLKSHILSLQNSSIHLFRNQAIFDNYFVVRYEDLLRDTSRTMKEVSDFLDIPFHENLTQPTLMGQPWGGNSTTGQKFDKISTQPLTAWQSQISDFEIDLVNGFLGTAVEQMGYEPLSPKRSKLIPAPKEKLGVYFKNRSLLWCKPTENPSP